jgi:hypothetical protein
MGISAVASSGQVRAIQGYPARRRETERDRVPVPDSSAYWTPSTPFLLRTWMVALKTHSARHVSVAFVSACLPLHGRGGTPRPCRLLPGTPIEAAGPRPMGNPPLRRLPAVASTPVFVSRSASTKTPFSVFRILIFLGICCRLMAPCIEHLHTQYFV